MCVCSLATREHKTHGKAHHHARTRATEVWHVVAFHCDMKPLKTHKCTGKQGVCSFAGEEHVQLSFDTEQEGKRKVPLTEEAEVYPAALCNILAERFCGAREKRAPSVL